MGRSAFINFILAGAPGWTCTGHVRWARASVLQRRYSHTMRLVGALGCCCTPKLPPDDERVDTSSVASASHSP